MRKYIDILSEQNEQVNEYDAPSAAEFAADEAEEKFDKFAKDMFDEEYPVDIGDIEFEFPNDDHGKIGDRVFTALQKKASAKGIDAYNLHYSEDDANNIIETSATGNAKAVFTLLSQTGADFDTWSEEHEADIRYEYDDAEEYDDDVYAYHGVSRSDFY